MPRAPLPSPGGSLLPQGLSGTAWRLLQELPRPQLQPLHGASGSPLGVEVSPGHRSDKVSLPSPALLLTGGYIHVKLNTPIPYAAGDPGGEQRFSRKIHTTATVNTPDILQTQHYGYL